MVPEYFQGVVALVAVITKAPTLEAIEIACLFVVTALTCCFARGILVYLKDSSKTVVVKTCRKLIKCSALWYLNRFLTNRTSQRLVFITSLLLLLSVSACKPVQTLTAECVETRKYLWSLKDFLADTASKFFF